MSRLWGIPFRRCLSLALAALAGAFFLLAAVPDLSAVLTPGGGSSIVHAAASKADEAFLAQAKKLYYYEPARKARYLKFHKKHPNYKVSSVVWRVDANLDLGFYVKVTTVQDPSALDVLVSKNYKLPKSYKPEKLTAVDSARLRPEAAKALKKLKAAAKKDGVNLYAWSRGYRSYSTQKRLNGNTGAKERSPDKSRARAGHSEHQTGLAVDLKKRSGGFVSAGSKEAKWLVKNAWKYGFIVRYTEDNKKITGYISEPWHIRYIGVENAKLMHAKGTQSYEEFWVKYVAHQPPDTSASDKAADGQ